MKVTYIQINDRNISYKSWDHSLHDFVFIKESKENFLSSPVFEVIPLNFFCDINAKSCPELVRFSHDGKLTYKYISNHHELRLDSPFIESNLNELGHFLSLNYNINTIKHLRLYKNSFRYLWHNKIKWEYRVSSLIGRLNEEQIEKKLYAILFNLRNSNKCLCHGDIVFSNILCDRGNIMITDFEYSLISEPEFDLSRFFQGFYYTIIMIVIYRLSTLSIPFLKILIQNWTWLNLLIISGFTYWIICIVIDTIVCLNRLAKRLSFYRWQKSYCFFRRIRYFFLSPIEHLLTPYFIAYIKPSETTDLFKDVNK